MARSWRVLQAGAVVRHEYRQGKGGRATDACDIDADIYIMADGDDTYDASISPVHWLNNWLLNSSIWSLAVESALPRLILQDIFWK